MRVAVCVAALAAAIPGWAANYYVTLGGLGGEKEFEVRFSGWVNEMSKLLQEGGAKVKVLNGESATRDALREALQTIAREALAEDSVALLMVGHGTFDGADYKINLPGPDMAATELGRLLDGIKARVLVVNMTSASGGSLPILQKENRAIITATKSGTERNATVFARYWIEALRDAAADTDKNDVISALEAFRFAEQKTAKYYETQKRLATEHALLEDTGRGEGVKDPSAANGQGLLAGRFAVLRLGAAQAAARTPEKQKLYERKEQLEQQIDRLKYQKAAMPGEVYRKQLQGLLLELAKVQAEIDQ
ncbi:MAG: hypothetical protein FJW40_09000 [Acidobacteria bacterium]|nr:hypothetical protein [Acidobacteriota bacterium]